MCSNVSHAVKELINEYVGDWKKVACSVSCFPCYVCSYKQWSTSIKSETIGTTWLLCSWTCRRTDIGVTRFPRKLNRAVQGLPLFTVSECTSSVTQIAAFAQDRVKDHKTQFCTLRCKEGFAYVHLRVSGQISKILVTSVPRGDRKTHVATSVYEHRVRWYPDFCILLYRQGHLFVDFLSSANTVMVYETISPILVSFVVYGSWYS